MTAQLPTKGHFDGSSTPGPTQAQFKTAADDLYDLIRMSSMIPEALTISGGVVSPTEAFGTLTIDTESAASTDDLTTITTTNYPDGAVIIVRAADATHDVVLKHNNGGSGEIELVGAADITLTDTDQFVMLMLNGSAWQEVVHSHHTHDGDYYTQAQVDTALALRLLAASNLSDVADAATARANLGVEIDVDVQSYDVDTAKLDVEQAWSKMQRPAANSVSSSSGTLTIDWSTKSNVVKVALTEDITTITLSNIDDSATVEIWFTQHASSSYTVAGWSSITWHTSDGAAPSMPSDNGEVMIVQLKYQGSGNYIASVQNAG